MRSIVTDWRESIRLAVREATTVLACWSKDAVEGRREQFHYEAYMGMTQQKLSQRRIDLVDLDAIGMPYTFDHIADLSTLERSVYNPELDFLMQDIARQGAPKKWFRFW